MRGLEAVFFAPPLPYRTLRVLHYGSVDPFADSLCVYRVNNRKQTVKNGLDFAEQKTHGQ